MKEVEINLKGRPGWHIECSAMAKKYGGMTIDIHGGARDLIFPHHENEIAQSEGANDKQFCRYWMHTGFLTVNGEKMSKSLGNFVTLKDALDKFDPNAIRMFFLQTHYRSPIDYNESVIEAAGESVERIFNCIGLIDEELSSKKDLMDDEFRIKTDGLVSRFYSAMEADFDTPSALAVLFGLVSTLNSHLTKRTIDKKQLRKIKGEIIRIFNIFGLSEKKKDIESKKEHLRKLSSLLHEESEWKLVFHGKECTEKVLDKMSAEFFLEDIIIMRERARKDKNFAVSDKIRAELKKIGIELEDKEGKVRWKAV